MSKAPDKDEADELFFDQLKDQFVFFYAATLTAMEAYKKVRAHYQKSVTAGKRDHQANRS